MKHWDKYDLGGVFDVFDFDKKMALINLDMIYEYAIKLDNIVSEESQLEDWVKMKLTRIEQNVSDVAHSLEGWEKFDEGGMVFKKQLLSISKYAHKLIEMIKGGSKLMSWQENKLAVSANDIDNLYHHLDYKVGNRASQNKFATGGMMKYPDLSNETPIVINEPNNQKISEIDIALIDIALVRKDLGIEKTKIGSSEDAYRIFKQLWNKDSINVREEMNVLFLNNANEPIGYYEHTKGAINSTLVDVEMIAALALKTLSKGVILAHNHPSGNNKPSEADIKLYQQVKTALKMFNITVLDSMILVPNSDNYYSLADNGYEMGGSLSFERGGSVYRIVEGYDHYKGMPLYQVIGDNDYVGEYHTDRKDAEKELQELIGGVGENIKSYRYGFDTYIQVEGTNYGGKLVLGRGKVKGKENVYLSHIDWDENNVPENSEEIEEYVDKNLNNLLQNAQQYNNGGGVGVDIGDFVQLKKIDENLPYEIRSGIVDNKWKIVRVSKSGRSMNTDIMEDVFGYDIELLDEKLKYKMFVYPTEVKPYKNEKYANGGGVGEIKFEELVGNKFSIKRGSGTKTTTWEKEDLLEEIKGVIKHELFDRDFYYNWTDEGAEYYNIFDKYTLTPMLKDIDKTLNEYFVMKKTPYDNILEFKEHSKIQSIKELSQGYIDNWFKTNSHISPMLRNDYKKYREKYAGVTPYAKGGGVGEYKIKKQYENSVIVELPFNAYKSKFDLDDRLRIQQKVNKDLNVNYNWMGYSVENDKTFVVLGKEKYAKGGGVDYKIVAFPEALMYKYFVVDEDNDNYLTVQEDMFDKWKNASKIEKAEYYSEWIPKNEMVEVMAKGGGVEESINTIKINENIIIAKKFFNYIKTIFSNINYSFQSNNFINDFKITFTVYKDVKSWSQKCIILANEEGVYLITTLGGIRSEFDKYVIFKRASMGYSNVEQALIDGNYEAGYKIPITDENLVIKAIEASGFKKIKEYSNGGGVGEYKVGDTFIGTPNAKYDASWQLFKPSTSYVIDNKTNKIISIHNTPYDAIVERDNTNPNFKTHFKVYPKEHYKETGGGVSNKVLIAEYKENSYYFEPNTGKFYVNIIDGLGNRWNTLKANTIEDIDTSKWKFTKKGLELFPEIDIMAKGGNINSGRDALFKSQEPHEQRYKRKREWKEYKKEGWFGDWYEMGGNVSSELSEPQKEFSKSAEMLVRENLQNGEICMCKLKKILGHEPNYPKQVVGSLVLEKAYLRNFYKI